METYKLIKGVEKLKILGLTEDQINLLKNAKSDLYLKISSDGKTIEIIDFLYTISVFILLNEKDVGIIFNILSNVQDLIEQKALKLC